jgi:hypothetical protein
MRSNQWWRSPRQDISITLFGLGMLKSWRPQETHILDQSRVSCGAQLRQSGWAFPFLEWHCRYTGCRRCWSWFINSVRAVDLEAKVTRSSFCLEACKQVACWSLTMALGRTWGGFMEAGDGWRLPHPQGYKCTNQSLILWWILRRMSTNNRLQQNNNNHMHKRHNDLRGKISRRWGVKIHRTNKSTPSFHYN